MTLPNHSVSLSCLWLVYLPSVQEVPAFNSSHNEKSWKFIKRSKHYTLKQLVETTSQKMTSHVLDTTELNRHSQEEP